MGRDRKRRSKSRRRRDAEDEPAEEPKADTDEGPTMDSLRDRFDSVMGAGEEGE